MANGKLEKDLKNNQKKKGLKCSLNHPFDTMMIRGLFVPWKTEFFSSLLRSKAKAAKQRVSKPSMKCHHENRAQISKKKIPVITGVSGREWPVSPLQRKAIRTI